jgi:hypothetical protein
MMQQRLVHLPAVALVLWLVVALAAVAAADAAAPEARLVAGCWRSHYTNQTVADDKAHTSMAAPDHMIGAGHSCF